VYLTTKEAQQTFPKDGNRKQAAYGDTLETGQQQNQSKSRLNQRVFTASEGFAEHGEKPTHAPESRHSSTS
jgi:hypothetical protein